MNRTDSRLLIPFLFSRLDSWPPSGGFCSAGVSSEGDPPDGVAHGGGAEGLGRRSSGVRPPFQRQHDPEGTLPAAQRRPLHVSPLQFPPPRRAATCIAGSAGDSRMIIILPFYGKERGCR